MEDREFGNEALMDSIVEVLALFLASAKGEDQAIMRGLLSVAEERRYHSDLYSPEYARAFASLRRRLLKVAKAVEPGVQKAREAQREHAEQSQQKLPSPSERADDE